MAVYKAKPGMPNTEQPSTGDGKTTRDIYDGKINLGIGAQNGRPQGDLKVEYKTADER